MPTTKKTASASGNQRVVRRRMRAVTSCTDCHRRKQKCDRETPCSNCTVRGNQAKCHYEFFPPEKYPGIHNREQIIKLNANSSFPSPDGATNNEPHGSSKDSALKVQALGFSDGNTTTSIGLYNKALEVDGSIPVESNTTPASPPHTPSPWASTAWYRASLRTLPPSTIIDNLAANFFNNVNWQYNPLDMVTFMEDKARWDRLTYADVSNNLLALPPDTRFFPALLFQVLALSLLYWDVGDSRCDSLKYKSDMTLEDVAREYSEAGLEMASILSRDELPRAGIQVNFLRTIFLKTLGKVQESWDSLGETINGARCLQWHQDVLVDDSPQPVRSMQYLWDCETRRKTWLNLCCWDAHMSIMLGRPLRVTLRDMETTPPIDAPATQDRTRVAPYPRQEFDLPTLLTVQIVYHSVARFLIRVSLIQPKPGMNDEIQSLHEEIMDFSEHLPPYLWLENPDRRFDSHPDCFWLPDAREAVEATIWFTILALHRPHIFRNSKNRSHALRAGLCTLRAERKNFNDRPLRKYRSFAYLFATFDAAVTVASIYTLYPKDNPRSREEAIQGVDTVIDHFERVKSLNPLAETAANVLKALQVRIRRAARGYPMSTPASSTPSNAESSSNAWTPPVYNVSGSQAYQETDTCMDESLAALPPPLPLHDLLYNSLSGTSFDKDLFPEASERERQDSILDWQFQGQFDNDAFWTFMNQMEPWGAPMS